MNKLLKKIWIAAAVLIILAAVASSVFRSLTPWAKQYKGEVEQHLTELLGQPVTVHSMETGWYWFHPVLKLKEINIHGGDKKSLHLDKLLIGIDLFKSLWYRRIQSGMLYVDDIHLVVRQMNDHWKIDGINTPSMNDEVSLNNSQQILVWLSQQDRLIMKNVSVLFHFSDGGVIPLQGLNLSLSRKNGSYMLKGSAHLAQTNTTYFQLLGNLNFDPYHLEETDGKIYFSAKNALPVQWQNLFSNTIKPFEGGKGDIALWVDFNKGKISLLQSQIKFKRVAWRILSDGKTQFIQNLYANLSWKPNDKGWQFNADHIKLRTGGIAWPENQLLIKFDKIQQEYQIFVKSILIESLLSQAIDWPPVIKNILDLKPHGVLSDTQLSIKDKQAHYILTRFDQLGWDARDNIPQVENLSGVLNWQLEEGRLELDSENTYLGVKDFPPQRFELLNGAFDWKELSNGLRVSIERFVLSKPELTISTQGAIDEVTTESIGNIRLATEFSGKNLQQWLAYLPAKNIKAKLYDWLVKDIKKINEASGKIIINGHSRDFPFDNNNGEFSITSHASGIDLLINSKWQLIKDIDAYFRLKNRDLDIDIVNADIQGVPVKQMNLRIDAIGQNKENLLIHGMINGAAQKILNYVLASPLREKLSSLKMLTIKGLVSLNLRLEIPLYPENDDNLVKGDLVFKNNSIIIKHQLREFPIEDVTGNMAFDEEGVTQGTLVASSFGFPVTIDIHSVKIPQSATLISVDGACSIESLKNRFNSPVLSLLHGMFSIKANLKLHDKPDLMDTMHLESSLKGLTINLPMPLGKKQDAEAPLEVKFDLSFPKELRLRANYNKHISADLSFQDNKGMIEFKSGEILLGGSQALNQKIPGLALGGTLDGFDLQEWKKVYSKFSSEQNNNNSIFQKLRRINLKMNKLTLFNQKFDNMSMKGKVLKDNNWSFSLEQNKIAADLTYYSATNSLSGFVKHLNLAKIDSLKHQNHTETQVNPGQIPNLNLRIDNLSVGEIKIGDVTLKSKSTPNRWLIDYCRIDSPMYKLNIEGDWVQKGKNNQTKMQIKLHLNDLARSLERWQISPAVDAGKGDLQFNGGWNGSIYDFSLATLNGNMYLELKDGRITHLSPETEEKLGLGKLLSVLSLQTIPRRLKLDFSDLSHEGYSFDIFKGNFKIKNGIMNTQDSYIDGPVAYASMKGDLDLVKRLYDLNLSISPHITASLPIVATIAGGPVVGLAAWVANKIINQSMQKITAYSYKISGPWKEPIVQQLTIVRKVVKK